MKARFFYYVGIIALCSNSVRAQDDALTTIILLRHAEKEGQNAMTSNNKDPNLSAQGQKRAEKLVELFSRTTIDAIYSTPFIRTKSTVEPLARSKSLTVFEYQPGDLGYIDKITVANRGKTIVICGHSNTIPKIANHLMRSEQLKDFDDSEYGNILIVTISSDQKSSKLTWLSY